jgi:O-succinylbenzoic acid--CoA ligase
MTETLSHVALRKINGPDKSEWFQPLPGVSISLDERDCIVIDAPRLSSQKIVTNDIAILEGTRFKVLGRYDDVIISAGNKLHPAAIEKKLEPIIQSPFFVFGEKHSEALQSLVLCIESKESSFDVENLKKQMGEILDKPEMPRRIAVIPKFSYLESGKIDRINTLNHDYNY